MLDLVSKRFEELQAAGKIKENNPFLKQDSKENETEDLVSKRFKELQVAGKIKEKKEDKRWFKREPWRDEDIPLIPALKQGYKSGVSGILSGQGEQEPFEGNIPNRLAYMAGEIVSDLPAIVVGGQAGAIAGAPIGGIGAAIGGGAGAFALPDLIKSAVNQYRKYHKGEDITIGKALGNIALSTGKSAITGVVASQVGKLLPYMRELPYGRKLLDTKIGSAAGKIALEAGGIEATQSALEGRKPTLQGFGEGVAQIGGMYAAGAIGKKLGIKKAIKPVVQPMVDSVSSIASKIGKILPETVREFGSDVYEGASKLRKNTQQKKFFNMLEDHVGKRDAKIVESQFNWREKLAEAEKSGKFSAQNKADMIYYRQKIGNPFVKGDTFEKLAKRLPANARSFVDGTVKGHLDESLKAWNKDPATENINPRDAVFHAYLPNLYEGSPAEQSKAYEKVAAKFGTKNPLSNQKTFLNYMEAFKEAGLKPKYNNIIDLMGAYDRIMIKSMANNKLIENIRNLEKNTNTDLIVNSFDAENYKKAKDAGYVPFDDLYLRRSDVSKKDGKPTYRFSNSPALVHPDFASAFQGVFTKNASKREMKGWKYYDAVNNRIKYARIAGSPFHYMALMESAVGSRGLKALNVRKMTDQGRALRNNKEFMMEAAEAGLKTDAIEGKTFKTPSLLDKAIKITDNAMESGDKKMTPAVANSFLKKTKTASEYLFEEFHPNLKAVTWNDLRNEAINELVKDGKPPSDKEIKVINKQMAELTNNMFGGQRWETMRHLNDPSIMKKIRRVSGYPDWRISAARQAADIFSSGIKGRMSRKYWARYMLGFGLTQALMRAFYGGWEQADPDKKVSGVKFNPNKAWDALVGTDPSKSYQFPLPDVDLKVAGASFNPGKNKEGRKLYAHTGKQMLEIPRYKTNFWQSMFSMAAPPLQMAIKQILAGAPTGDGVYPEQAAMKKGKLVPWSGAESGSASEYISRLWALCTDILPYGLMGLTKNGLSSTIATGFGALPISKGISIIKAEPLARKAYKSKNYEEVNNIREALRDNGYSYKSIKAMLTRARKN